MALVSERLGGKVALVTGGASGIGEAACRLFAVHGAGGVVIADINDEAGRALADELGSGGGKVVFEHLDVSQEPDWIHVMESVKRRFGRLDVLVNNAGRGGPLSRPKAEHTTVEGWEVTLATNARGVLLGIKHAVPLMRAGGGGSIINTASVYSIVGDESGGTAYAASKGAVRALSRTAALQYAGEGIRVNAVFPGFVETPMTRNFHAQPGVREKRTAMTPLGRLAQPDDIAWGILFLATDESAYMTGSELVIDGGVSAR
jgi:NAD(P)-dependent dehydrogenase (short-subunit alcohol dehydrogenase family)